MTDISDDQPFVPKLTLTQSLADVRLFGKVFASPSFWTWKVIGKLLDGLPLTEPREIELFKECTGRTQLPNRHEHRLLRRFILLVGRRGGKDRFESAVAVWRAALCADWQQYISAGEQAVVILLGRDRKHAAILRRYCQGLLQAPLLAAEITRNTGDLIEFRNGSSLEIISNDAALVRGRSAIAVLGSECCHWRTSEHAASSDEEVVGAAEPSMAMTPDGGLLLLGSSVYRKRGYCYRKFRELHGNNDTTDIVWHAPSTTMNPALPQRVVDAALAEDPYRGGAEFLGRWREDLSDFVPLDAIEACTATGVYERPPQRDITYIAFVDAAGGTGSDHFAVCVCHREDSTVVMDLIRGRAPRFIPRDVIAEYAELLKRYNIREVRGDNYAGGFHSDEWLRNDIVFTPSEFTTSENYLRALPALLAGRAKLLDNATLRNQLASLERFVQPSGHEVVRHPQIASAHDDLATACAGALVAAEGSAYLDATWCDDTTAPTNNGADAFAQLNRSLYYLSGGATRLW